MITEVPRENWTSFFNDLSRDLDGWESRIEHFSSDVGAQILSDGLPFHGLTVEQKDGKFSIELSIGSGTVSHQTHTINEAVKVAFEAAGIGPAGVLDIEDASGSQTLIRFIQPFPMLVEYVKTDIVQVAADRR